MSWQVVFTAQAQKDARKIARAGLRPKVEHLLDLLRRNPLETPPRYEKLVGDLGGAFSRRINIQHRLARISHQRCGQPFARCVAIQRYVPMRRA